MIDPTGFSVQNYFSDYLSIRSEGVSVELQVQEYIKEKGIMKALSDMSFHIDGQPMFKVLDKVTKLEKEGKKIFHFELGEPDFDTPKNITQAAVDSLHNGETHYTSSMGLSDFRMAICQATQLSRDFTPEIEQVLVTPGANSIIYFSICCLVNPGEEVIVPDPGFPTYYSAIKVCGAKPVKVPIKEENSFRLSPKDILDKISKNTRLIILNSPSNPTGAVMTADEIKEIANIAEEKDIYILSDEIYSRMIYDHDVLFRSPSFLDICKKRTIILNGLSKAFAMTGWRVGVAIGPAEVIEKMGLLLQTIISCVPPFVQRAGIEAILGDQKPIYKMIDQYKQRRDLLVDGLNSIENISCLSPPGAIYVFPNIKETGMSSEDFSDFALKKAGLALLPGTNFGTFGEGYVRLCYAVKKSVIEEAIESLRRALRRR